MASESSSRKATLAVVSGSSSRKGAVDFCSRKSTVGSAPSASRSDSKSDELWAPKKGTSTPSHTNTPASSHTSTPAPSHMSTPAPSPANASTLTESTLVLKYSKTDQMKILKIFSETKGQEPKAEVARKRLLKANVPDVYFEKLHMDCYYFCQQCEDHFVTAGATGSNHTPFAASFLCGKINFW